jgi:hypothetical protein
MPVTRSMRTGAAIFSGQRRWIRSVVFSEATALRKMEARKDMSIAYKYVDSRWMYQQHMNVSTVYEPVDDILVA